MPFHQCRSVFISGLLCLLTILLSGPLSAEEPSSADPTPAPPQITSEERREIMRKFSEISRKINEQPDIAALREKMTEAQTAYREAFEAAVAKEDPEVLEQYREMREAMRSRPGLPGSEVVRRRVGVGKSGYDELNDEERQQLDAARRQAMQAPNVVEARQKRNNATTEEERRTAVEEYREALHKAMIEADEEVEGLLEKLQGKSETNH